MEGINNTAFRKGWCDINHTLKIKVTKNLENGGIVTVRQKTIREKLLRFLLGKPIKLTVLVPGDSVDEVAIHEVKEGGNA